MNQTKHIFDPDEYHFGAKWFADWHREQPDLDAKAIDIDLLGYCKRCLHPLYLIEATRGRNRKNASVLEHLGRMVGVPVWVVYQDKTGGHPGEILVDNRTVGVHHGWLPEAKVWRMLQAIRSAHACAQQEVA